MHIPLSKNWLEQRVHAWQKRLGLEAWRIDVRVEACDTSTCYAQIARAGDYKDAVLSVQPWLLGDGRGPDTVMHPDVAQDRQRVEEIIVHELLHLAVQPMRRVVDTLDGQLHRDVARVFDDSLDQAEERVVDELARALVSEVRA
jgi:hypothetical protein